MAAYSPKEKNEPVDSQKEQATSGSEAETGTNKLTVELLSQYLEYKQELKDRQLSKIPLHHLVLELEANGYSTLQQINSDFEAGFQAACKYETGSVILNRVGLLRIALLMSNEDYNKKVNNKGRVVKMRSVELREYMPFRQYVIKNLNPPPAGE